MLNCLPVLLQKAVCKRITPLELSRRWGSISEEIEQRCQSLQREFDCLYAQVSGRTRRAQVEKTLRGVYRKEADSLQTLLSCMNKWIAARGGSAYLRMARESLDLAEELWRRRIKALVDLSDRLHISWSFPSSLKGA
ncbi:hypothetical protein IJT93_00715 [bacterium]|nr:hypothetical protein [bacterium]